MEHNQWEFFFFGCLHKATHTHTQLQQHRTSIGLASSVMTVGQSVQDRVVELCDALWTTDTTIGDIVLSARRWWWWRRWRKRRAKWMNESLLFIHTQCDLSHSLTDSFILLSFSIIRICQKPRGMETKRRRKHKMMLASHPMEMHKVFQIKIYIYKCAIGYISNLKPIHSISMV